MWIVHLPFAEILLDRWDANEERNQKKKKDNEFWLLWRTFKEYIKQNIIMEVLGKTNFHSFDICRLIKNQSCKKGSRREMIQNLIFAAKVAHEILRI